MDSRIFFRLLQIVLTIVVAVTPSTMSQAQGGPPAQPLGQLVSKYVPTTESLIVQSSTALAVYDTQKFGLSTDAAQHWIYEENPLYYANLTKLAFSPAYEIDQTLVAGTAAGMDSLLISTDQGQSWQTTKAGVAGPVYDIALSPAFATDSTMFAAVARSDGAKVIRTSDKGTSWQNVSPPMDQLIRQIALSSTYQNDKHLIVLGDDNQAFLSQNGGDSWVALTIAEASLINALHLSTDYSQDGALFASTDVGLLKSVDRGTSWQPLTEREKILRTYTAPGFAQNQTLLALRETTGEFGITTTALLRSTDGGITWHSPLPVTDVVDMQFAPDYLVTGTIYAVAAHTLYRSTDFGAGWQEISSRFPWQNGNLFRTALSPNFSSDGLLFVHSGENVLLRSTDAAQTWSAVALPEEPQEPIGGPGGLTRISVAISPDVQNGRKVYLAINRNLYLSTTLGESWELVSNSLPVDMIEPFNDQHLQLSPHFAGDQTMFFGNYTNGLYRSQDGGQHWTLLEELNNAWGIHPQTTVALTGYAISPAYATDKTVFASAYNQGVARSVDAGNTWTYLEDSGYLISPDNLLRISPTFAEDNTVFIAGNGSSGGGLAKSTNRGNSWQNLTTEELAYYVKNLSISPNYQTDQTLIIDIESREPKISEDGGQTWSPLRGMPMEPVGIEIAVYDGRIMPIAITQDTVMRYQWPVLTFKALPGLLCFSAAGETTERPTYSVTVATHEPISTNWLLDIGNARNVTFSSTEGVTPGTFTVSSSALISDTVSGSFTVNLALSARQRVSQQIGLAEDCHYSYLPLLNR